MNIMMLYSLSNWLPTVVTGMGYSAQTAVLVGTVLQVGGTVGTFGLAWLIARRGFIPVLTFTFALAAISIAFIGQPGISLATLVVVVFIAGWCVVGGQPGLNAMSGTFYPTYLRSTGVGAGLGVGRAGGIVGPLHRRHAAGAAVVVAAALLGGGAAGDRLDDHSRHAGRSGRDETGRRAGPVRAEEVTLAR